MVKREPIDPGAVYSREEVAELLGVSLSTIKRLIAARQLEVSRPDSIRRIFPKPLQAAAFSEHDPSMRNALDERIMHLMSSSAPSPSHS